MKTEIKPGESSTALAEAPDTGVANNHYAPEQYDDTSRDTNVPVLGLVNGVGPLAKQFRNNIGEYVLGDQVLGKTVSAVPVAAVKFFIEKARGGKELKYGTPEAATKQFFQSATDAAKAGYVVDFSNRAPNRVEEAARIGWLVLAPAGTPDDSVDFAIRSGEHRFALAKCTYQRGGYREVFRRVFDYANKLATLRGLNTKGLDHAGVFNAAQAWDSVWTLTADECEGNGNTWFEPRIARGAKLTPEAVAWIGENYGALRA